MPLIYHKSQIKARQENASLVLKSCHYLGFGEDLNVGRQSARRGAVVHELKKALPPSLDVFSHSDLAIKVSVVMNGHCLSSGSVERSLMALHLVRMLRKNSNILGINNVSTAYIDDSDGHVKVHITPQRSVPPEQPNSQISLLSIHLTYRFKTMQDSAQYLRNIVERDCILKLLNQTVGSLLNNQFAKRHPLIFGPWGRKLVLEKPYFRSIAKSLISMTRRSPNDDFRVQVNRYFKILRKRLRQWHLESVRELEACCGGTRVFEGLLNNSLDHNCDEETILGAMHLLYKLALRPSIIRCASVAEDEIDLQDEESESPQCVHLILDEADDRSDFVENEDLICSSELDNNSDSPLATNLSFLSGLPPPPAGLYLHGTQDMEDILEEETFMQVHATTDHPEQTRYPCPLLLECSDADWDLSPGSDVYDSDTDSDCLSISSLHRNSSSTLCPESDLGDKTTDMQCTSDGFKEVLATATEMCRTGHEANLTHFTYQSHCPYSSSRDSSLRLPSDSILHDDQDLFFDYDERSNLDKNNFFDGDSATYAASRVLDTKTTKTSLSLLSCPNPLADIPAPPISFAEDGDLFDEGLDSGDVPDGESRGSWRAEDRFSTSQGAHPGFTQRDVYCTAVLETRQGSGDQATFTSGLPEDRDSRTDVLNGEFDAAVLMDIDCDLGMDLTSDEELEDFATVRNNPNRKEFVEIALESAGEEYGECRWSSLV